MHAAAMWLLNVSPAQRKQNLPAEFETPPGEKWWLK
jgi:hypothetical protein